jgi:hypothetical protein
VFHLTPPSVFLNHNLTEPDCQALFLKVFKPFGFYQGNFYATPIKSPEQVAVETCPGRCR